MTKRRILLILLALILFVPSNTVLGDDGQNNAEDQELVNALVFMATHNATASGGLTTSEVSSIQVYVEDYYNLAIQYATQSGKQDLVDFWKNKKNADMNKLNSAYSKALDEDENVAVFRFFKKFFSAYLPSDDFENSDPVLANTVAHGAAQASQAGNDQNTQQNQSLLAASAA
jgi:hypothetical protein